MSRIFGHFGDQPSFQQFDGIIVSENARLNHGVILIYTEAPDDIGWIR